MLLVRAPVAMFTGYIAGNAYQIDAQRNQRVAVTVRPRRTRVFLRMRSLDGIASADDVGESAKEVINGRIKDSKSSGSGLLSADN